MSRRTTAGMVLALFSGWMNSAHALEMVHGEPLQTDRPDFVESSDVVGKGRVQIEASVAQERDNADGVRTRLRSTPTLLRIGLSDNLELRFETDGALRLMTEEDGVRTYENGVADLAFGVKWHMLDADEATNRPSVGWLLHVDTDTGSPAFRGQGWRPSLRMVAEWEWASGYSLGLMPGFYNERNDEDKGYVGGIMAVVAGKSLSDKLRAFVEWSGQQLTTARNGGNIITGDVGVAYLLTSDVQVDTAVAWGLSKAAPDFGVTFGLSIRF